MGDVELLEWSAAFRRQDAQLGLTDNERTSALQVEDERTSRGL